MYLSLRNSKQKLLVDEQLSCLIGRDETDQSGQNAHGCHVVSNWKEPLYVYNLFRLSDVDYLYIISFTYFYTNFYSVDHFFWLSIIYVCASDISELVYVMEDEHGKVPDKALEDWLRKALGRVLGDVLARIFGAVRHQIVTHSTRK